MVGRVFAQQLVAEPLHLSLIGDVASMAADTDTVRSVRLCHRHGLRDGSGVPVTRRDRAPLRGQLTDQLAAHPRAAASHHRKLAREPIHSRMPLIVRRQPHHTNGAPRK